MDNYSKCKIEQDKIKRILIIKMSSVGDIVHSIPFLQSIKSALPDAEVDWLLEEEGAELIKGHKDLKKVIVFPKKRWKGMLTAGNIKGILKESKGFLKDLRSHRYDLVVDLQGLLKSGIMISIVRGKRKVGFSWAREGSSLFINEGPYRISQEQHAIDRYLKALDYLGLASGNGLPIQLPISHGDRKKIERYVPKEYLRSKRLIAINPVARWKTKCWQKERFSMLSDRIFRELGYKVIFTGSEEDKKVISDIKRDMKTDALDLSGILSLKEAAYLYSRCSILISPDTGPMHIGAAVGCRVLALFGPTDPVRTGPYGDGHLVIRAEVDCSPCFKKNCNDMKCMEGIYVDMVFEGIRELLKF